MLLKKPLDKNIGKALEQKQKFWEDIHFNHVNSTNQGKGEGTPSLEISLNLS